MKSCPVFLYVGDFTRLSAENKKNKRKSDRHAKVELLFYETYSAVNFSR